MTPTIENAPSRELAATAPLTEEGLQQSFTNEDELTASILRSLATGTRAADTPMQTQTKKRPGEPLSGSSGTQVSTLSYTTDAN